MGKSFEKRIEECLLIFDFLDIVFIMYSNFITAAEGRRDNYEFSLALSQSNILKKHVTDFYTPDLLKNILQNFDENILFKKLLIRNNNLLSSKKVYSSKRLIFYSLIKKIIFKNLNFFRDDPQNIISNIALELAEKYDAGMFLYAGYAYYAFKNDKNIERPKGLIQYHPHIEKSSEILLADLEKYKYLTDAHNQIKKDMEDKTNIFELNISDKVICHSKFTADTIMDAGISKEKIITIPYGIDIEYTSKSKNNLIKPKERCNFLFVGQGIHRKGLHHLLLAWKKAALNFSTLNIISRYIDPQIKINAEMSDNIYFHENIEDTIIEYQKNDVFVMPSIIEGFGYVYLEALSQGLFCIGTKNSGLKDISTDKSCRIIETGDIENLSNSLNELQDILLTEGIDREMIKCSIKKFTWQNYRKKVSNVAKEVLKK